MTYCTQQDMTESFGEAELIVMTDRDHSGDIDVTVLEQAIKSAAAEIDGYLAALLPLSSTPEVLTLHACNIARYRLYDKRSNDVATECYKQAIRFLEMVAQGKISLGQSTNEQEKVSRTVTAKQGVSSIDWEAH